MPENNTGAGSLSGGQVPPSLDSTPELDLSTQVNNNEDAGIFTIEGVNDQVTRNIELEPTEPDISATVEPEPVTTAKTDEIVLPVVNVEPTIQVDATQEDSVPAPDPEPVKTETTNVTPVTSTQEIKSNELNNKAAENSIKEQENQKAIVSFQSALETGNIKDLAEITKNNPDLRNDFNSLVKNKLSNKSNTEFFGKYSSFTNNELLAAVKSGDIVVGSERYNLLPEAQRASFQTLLNQENANNALESNKEQFDVDNNKTISLDNIFNSLKDVFSTNLRKEYEEAMNSSEINDVAKGLEDKQNEINSLNDSIKAVEDEVKKQYPHLTGTQQQAVIADRQKSLLTKKNTLVNEYNSKLGTYKSLKDTAQTELDFLKYEDQQNKELYNTALSLYETRRLELRADATAAQKAEAERENAIFEAKNKQMAEELQYSRDVSLLEYKAYLSDNKITGKWVERDDGVYFEKSDGTRQRVVGSVTTPGINSNTVFSDGSAYSEVYDINNGGVGFTAQNTSLASSERELLNAPNGTRIPTRLNKDQLSPNNPGGKECGEYVNDIVARSVGTKIGSTWQSKTSYANESTGEVGSVAVWQVDPSNKESSKYGHAGVIVGETSDKSQWLIKSSNIKGQGVVSLVKVPKSVIAGYRSTNVIGTSTKFTGVQKTLLDSIETKDLVKKDNKKALSEAGLTLNQALEYKSENVSVQKKEDYTTALSLLDKMVAAGGGDGLSDAIGLFSWARNVGDNGEITFDPGSDAADFKAQYDALVDGLTLPNLDKMSGVLTDKDIELLKNASKGGLSLRMSEGDFKDAVQDLKGALNRAISGVKVPEGAVIFTDDDGIQYDKDTLQAEILRAINDDGLSPEKARQWLKDNNINL